ncbi:Uncharacterised protein [Mycobacterium tuberculosis]|nr:Uncharacterised protein [Mycobacterium tuberculosis]
MKNVANRRLDQRRVQSYSKRGHLTGQVVGPVAGTGLAGLDERAGNLGNQVGLPVGRGAEGA